MSSGFDYSGMLALQQDMMRLETGFDHFLEGFLLKQGLDALARTKENTPVDTGILRNAWSLDTTVRREGNSLVVIITNPTEYASYVELGHMTRNRKSFVPGKFMCAIAITQVKRKMPARFKQEFDAWLNGLGGLQ